MPNKFTTLSILLRWSLAMFGVLATYNPSGVSYWHWIGRGEGMLSLQVNYGEELAQCLIVALIVLAFWRSKFSATPGKMAIHAQIVDARTLGRPTLGQLVIRYLGYFVSTIPLCLGLMWVGFDRRKQGWHDKLADTVVIRVRR